MIAVLAGMGLPALSAKVAVARYLRYIPILAGKRRCERSSELSGALELKFGRRPGAATDTR